MLYVTQSSLFLLYIDHILYQSHQKAVPFKPKGFPFFDHLQLLVHGIIANGSNSFSAGSAPVPASANAGANFDVIDVASPDDDDDDVLEASGAEDVTKSDDEVQVSLQLQVSPDMRLTLAACRCQ